MMHYFWHSSYSPQPVRNNEKRQNNSVSGSESLTPTNFNFPWLTLQTCWYHVHAINQTIILDLDKTVGQKKDNTKCNNVICLSRDLRNKIPSKIFLVEVETCNDVT